MNHPLFPGQSYREPCQFRRNRLLQRLPGEHYLVDTKLKTALKRERDGVGQPLLPLVRASALFVMAVVLLTVGACGGGSGGGGGSESRTSDVTLSWTGSRHSAMNSPDSGYTVYYGTRADVQPGGAGVSTIDVPYDPELGKAPTTVVIENIVTGRWYFRVQAYGKLNTSSGAEQLTSPLSPESSFEAP